jgi:hypothetical protein
MTWHELKQAYLDDHSSKALKSPKIRINALGNIENIIKAHYSEIFENPSILLKIEKNNFKEMIAKFKDNSRLNGAEESVINGFYKFLKR